MPPTERDIQARLQNRYPGEFVLVRVASEAPGTFTAQVAIAVNADKVARVQVIVYVEKPHNVHENEWNGRAQALEELARITNTLT